MVAALREGDFALNEYVIGGDSSYPVYLAGLDTGVVDTLHQDTARPFSDSRAFGRDQHSGPAWTFELRFGRNISAATALAALGDVTHAWRSPSREPGDESVLRYRAGGRTRRVYGRPRNFSQNPNLLFSHGYLVGAGQFVTSDAFHYADELRSVVVTLVPTNAGGLVSPLISPLTTVAGGSRQGIISDVGGDAPAPVIVKFHGPVSAPSVGAGDWVVGLKGSLAHDESVTIDTRTMTVLRNDGASLAGDLTRGTYLSQARLAPGAQELVFRGSDSTGTATCTVSWRPTFYGF